MREPIYEIYLAAFMKARLAAAQEAATGVPVQLTATGDGMRRIVSALGIEDARLRAAPRGRLELLDHVLHATPARPAPRSAPARALAGVRGFRR